MLKLLFVPCVWNLLQIKYIFLRDSYFLKIKSFSFSCLLYYYLKGSMLLCFLLLYWVFIKSVFVVCLEVVAVCDILIFKNIAFFVIACCVCFGRVFDWVILDCFFWLFDLILFWLFIERLCFMRKKKNYGRTVHCNVAVVKPYVKMSAVWFKRLIFWFGRVLFVLKTLLCSECRFASGTS